MENSAKFNICFSEQIFYRKRSLGAPDLYLTNSSLKYSISCSIFLTFHSRWPYATHVRAKGLIYELEQ